MADHHKWLSHLVAEVWFVSSFLSFERRVLFFPGLKTKAEGCFRSFVLVLFADSPMARRFLCRILFLRKSCIDRGLTPHRRERAEFWLVRLKQ